MKVILKQKVEKLGDAWDTVNVKDGYARNFLFPMGLALEATKASLKMREDSRAKNAALQEKDKFQAQETAKKLQNASLTLSMEATPEDKLYGSVDAEELVKFLKSEGYDIDKKDILLDEPIRSLGVYNIDIKLHPEVTAKIKVWIVKK
ncbi:MAG: 50S ribosomal protein L9 [Omnitrophica WOR_2 bacterium RIFCSPLOWO2_12_FULL_46_30]|nr:MAG: 50S ribosomal protein L9 [Omnitrophica WOR_2 bacterium RIFCSPHIGHO2_02_FULL_46_37]OGX42667.1 MAG: 50S ribosomal protein L9 [Omnitrophica WOR_2 bacterium RIFCSPLOWO2_02_FULL_45_28]OGX51846.1 MAG: 50S ribosomal protein L9 [Omnitrophica WOR_2 bacterium RIFCSPLOWO2_12_FULL_46_30]